jgi:crossover junction endodeoxyribonuclease RuvC
VLALVYRRHREESRQEMKPKLYLGVDPGVSGALALLDAEGGVRDRIAMPLIKAAGGGKSEFDLAVIRDLLLVWKAEGDLFATVEKTQPMPPSMKFGGATTNFHRGMGRGWAWMLTAMLIPHQLVAPQRWQKVMHEGTNGEDTKAKSILAVHRLFPSVTLPRTARSTTENDGIADAILIAEYGRREHRGENAREGERPGRRKKPSPQASILDPEPAA